DLVRLVDNGTNVAGVRKVRPAGSFDWADAPASTGFGSEAFSVAADCSGNSYVTGYFFNSITFGSITLTADPDQYTTPIAKYDINGNILWATQIIANPNSTPQGNSEANSITVDCDNNVYISGDFTGQIT